MQRPAPPLLTVLDELLARIDENLGEDGPVRIAVQVWGEAVHDPEFADLISTIYSRVRSSAAALAERAQQDGQLPAGTDPAAIGSAIFGIIQGYILQRVLVGGLDRQMYLTGVGALLGAGDPQRPPATRG